MKKHAFSKRFDELCYTFESVGFVKIDQYVSQEKISLSNNLIDKWQNNFFEKHGSTPTKFPFLELDPLFMDLMSDPLIIDFGIRYLGEWFRFDHAIGLQQPSKSRNPDGSIRESQAINLHGGPSCSQGSCFSYTVNGKMRLGQLNVGIVLTEQSGKDGGFCYIPGSHQAPNDIEGNAVLQNFLSGNFDHPSIVTPKLFPGDLVIFTEAIIHGMAPWKASDKIRRNLYFKYSPGFLAWRDYEEIKKYLPLARTPIQKMLLRPPYVSQYKEDIAVGTNQFRESLKEENKGTFLNIFKKSTY